MKIMSIILMLGLFIFAGEVYSAEVTRTQRYFCVELCTADTNKGARYEYLFFQGRTQIARQISQYYANGPIIEESGSVPDGVVIERDKSRAQFIAMEYRDNRLHGPMRYFDGQGRFVMEHFYQKGEFVQTQKAVCQSDQDCLGVHTSREPNGDIPGVTRVTCQHKDLPLKEGEWLAETNWNDKCSCLIKEQRCKRISE